MKQFLLTITPELLRVLDALHSGNRVALVEDLLWSSPRVRAAAKRLGVERRPRPERGKYARRKVDCGGETR